MGLVRASVGQLSKRPSRRRLATERLELIRRALLGGRLKGEWLELLTEVHVARVRKRRDVRILP